MSKKPTPLEAAKELKDEVVANYYQDQNWFDERYEIIETALKDYEKKTKLAKEYADVDNVAKRLKALKLSKIILMLRKSYLVQKEFVIQKTTTY